MVFDKNAIQKNIYSKAETDTTIGSFIHKILAKAVYQLYILSIWQQRELTDKMHNHYTHTHTHTYTIQRDVDIQQIIYLHITYKECNEYTLSSFYSSFNIINNLNQ